MHESSVIKIRELLDRYVPIGPARKIIEIGSMLYTSGIEAPYGFKDGLPDGFPVGGFREDLTPKNSPQSHRGTYTGLDIEPGPNVDIVASDHYNWPIEDGSYDLVISGQCMEHVEDLCRWIDEVFRICTPGGLCMLIAPSAGPYHAFPVHCWLIMKDGMRFLLNRSGFEILEVDQWKKDPFNDCWGVGRKPL